LIEERENGTKENVAIAHRKSGHIELMQPAAQIEDDLVLTPGGWRSCSKVYELKKGHRVSGRGARL